MSPSINVDVRPEADGWVCQVEVREEGSPTRHSVRVTEDDLARLGGGRSPEQLVRQSFEFLLERESKESILPTFDLADISRYFPEYEREMAR
jgi:hypothetical protein